MAGNQRSGKRPDPAKATRPKPEGEPERPAFGFPEAAKLWDATVPWLVRRELVGASDGPMLRAMCEQWALYRACIAVMESELKLVADKDLRIAANSYLTACLNIAGRFGLTAADRARLLTSAADSSENSLAQFGIVG